MRRRGLGLVIASLAAHAASANDSLPIEQSSRTSADSRCSSLGEGFSATAGSGGCVRISGHISAGPGYGAGSESSGSVHLRFGPLPKQSPAAAATSGNLRFEGANSPVRFEFGAEKGSGLRWVTNGQ